MPNRKCDGSRFQNEKVALNAKRKMALDIELKADNDSECQTKDTTLKAKQNKYMTTLNVELDREWLL